jgi:hypothetical protein
VFKGIYAPVTLYVSVTGAWVAKLTIFLYNYALLFFNKLVVVKSGVIPAEKGSIIY